MLMGELAGRGVCVTGATGFLGKCVVEKILRSSPDVGEVFLLIRASSLESAKERLQKEIIQSEIFTRLRCERKDAEDFLQAKLIALPCDLTQPGLGLGEEALRSFGSRIHFIIHCAATVDFNKRLDHSVRLNVLGSLRLCQIARSFPSLRSFLHVSTAFVNAHRHNKDRHRRVEECLTHLDFDPALLVDAILRMRPADFTESATQAILGAFPNTYTFTKAITEHLLTKAARTADSPIPLTIVRPSIIGAAYKEPLPGWTDTISAAGAGFYAAGFGAVNFYPGLLDVHADLVPVDFVVDGLLMVMLLQSRRGVVQDHPTIWHLAVTTNPRCWKDHVATALEYFTCTRPPKSLPKPTVRFVPPPLFGSLFWLTSTVPASVFTQVAKWTGNSRHQKQARAFQKLVAYRRLVVDALTTFTSDGTGFVTHNIQTATQHLTEHERSVFWLDLSDLDWYSYVRTFCFGLLRYAVKDRSLVEVDVRELGRFTTLFPPLCVRPLSHMARDVRWLRKRDRCLRVRDASLQQIRLDVLRNPLVQTAIAQRADRLRTEPRRARDVRCPEERALGEAQAMLKKLVGRSSRSALNGTALFVRRLLRRLFDRFLVDCDSLTRVRASAASGLPLIYIPTHRSYLDFVALSYLCFDAGLPMPAIAAAEDFLGVLFVRSLFRHTGAFFLRRRFNGDKLYCAVFTAFVERVLQRSQALEFFIEGTRSRSGQLLQPKLGLLRVILAAVASGRVKDAIVVPVAVNYERTMEVRLHSDELMGNKKVKESLCNLLLGGRVLKAKFGTLAVQFGKLTRVSELLLSSGDPKCEENVRLTACTIMNHLKACIHIMPVHIVASLLLLYPHGVTFTDLQQRVEEVRKLVVARKGVRVLTNFSGRRRGETVTSALVLLGPLLTERPDGVWKPNVEDGGTLVNWISLAHYRNRLVHVFCEDSFVALAFHACCREHAHARGVPREQLVTDASFVGNLFRRELLLNRLEVEACLSRFLADGVLYGKQAVAITQAGETQMTLFASFLWPFVDAHFVLTLALLASKPTVACRLLVKKAQTLAISLYHRGMIGCFEACSKEELFNGLRACEDFGLVRLFFEKDEQFITILNPAGLQELSTRLARLKKPSRILWTPHSGTVANVPLLAKL